MKHRSRGRIVLGAALALLALGAQGATEVFYVSKGSTWRYFKGTQEASSPDTTAWRDLIFDDDAWLSGAAPFGYGEPSIPFGTELTDMRNNYTTLFLRQTFEVTDAGAVGALKVNLHYEDGLVIWINGEEVLDINAPAERTYNATTPQTLEPTLETRDLPDPINYLAAGTNVIAVQVFNTSVTSSDLVFDLDLFDPEGIDQVPPAVAAAVPAPGATVRALSQIQIRFTEPVTGVQARDLVVNDGAAIAVTGSAAGPYVFSFAPTDPGPVDVAWAADHGIVDTAVPPNPFAGGSWTYTLDPDAPLAQVVINEFLASNATSVKDEHGESQDWIELHNRGAEPVDLLGWSLTDDPAIPAKWTFPSYTLAANGFLVVFASGKDCRPGTAPPDPTYGTCTKFHTNFKLNRAGEYLALYDAGSPPQVVVEFTPWFPDQRRDHSYGFDAEGELRYFVTPTPGAPNSGPTATGFVEDPVFSVEHGLFSAPFWLTLSTATTGATIYYRMDPQGREVTEANGTRYTGPIQIAGASDRAVVMIRAIAVKAGILPSNTVTASYIFPEFVLDQSGSPPGFPATWGATEPADYELDQQVIGIAQNAARALDALSTRPSLCITMDIDDFLSPSRGIYANPSQEGLTWERPASAEMIYPEGRKGFQMPCGIRIQGGTSTSGWKSKKLSMRLLFKDDYGPTKLRFPLFVESPVMSFDTIVLDAHLNLTWTHPDHSQRVRSQYVRDAYVSDLQNAAGSHAPHDVFVNVFVNGVHWGMYDMHERPDDAFAASYLGGDKLQYDSFRHQGTNIVSGTAAAWNAMRGLALAGLSSLAAYESIQEYLDVADLCDYMIVNLYAGNTDWAHQNWYAARNRILPGSQFHFFSWDAEHVLKGLNDNVTGVSNANGPGELYDKLRDNAEFRLLFADRAHRLFFNGGALYVDPANRQWDPSHPERNRPAALYMKRIDEIDDLIVLESARWGDVRRPDQPYTRDAEWLAELVWLRDTYLPQRSAIALDQLRAAQLYPQVGAPIFNQHGGEIAPGFSLTMSRPSGTTGTIYYTTSGSDPRAYGTGAVAPGAAAYAGPVTLSATTRVKARVLQAGTWSALAEAVFRVPSPFDGLRVTEIMYHPLPAGALDGDRYEFIELKNTGTSPLDLTGVAFAQGIFFTFPEGSLIGAGAFAVLVADEAAFRARYPGIPVAGLYAGNLANDGDSMLLKGPDGEAIASFFFADAAWWPREADGEGRSLVPVSYAREVDLSDPASWRPSTALLGSPGADDQATGPFAPRIVQEPIDLVAQEGQEAIFTVVATGYPDPEFRWQRNDVDIPGATLPYYRTPAVRPSDNGARFRCIVANSEGSVTTREATLAVAGPGSPFKRGDANADGRVDISDAASVLRLLFAGGVTTTCADANDANDDGILNIADAIRLLQRLFAGGPPLAFPYFVCGADATSDALTCQAHAPCE